MSDRESTATRPGPDGPDAGTGRRSPWTSPATAAARVVWVVFLGGPVIWFAHFMLVYLVAEAGCTGDGPGLDAVRPPVPDAVTLAATAVAARRAAWACAAVGLPAVAAGGGPGRRRRAAGSPATWPTPTGAGRWPSPGSCCRCSRVVAVLFVGLPARSCPRC